MINKEEILKVIHIHKQFEFNRINNGPYLMRGINGNPEYSIYTYEEPSLVNSPFLLNSDFNFFKKFFGFTTGKEIQAICESSSFIISLFGNKEFVVQLNYNNEQYTLTFKLNENSLISDLYKNHEINQIEIENYFWVIKLTKNNKKIIDLDENIIYDILETLFFELEVNFTQGYFKLIEYPHQLLGPLQGKSVQFKNIPDIFNFEYKLYNQDLLDFYRIASEVNFTPFKYLSYYHILEYYSEKIIIKELKEKLIESYTKKDFDQKIDKYLLENIQTIKSKGNTKEIHSLRKILSKYGRIDEIIKFLEQSNLIEYFSKDLIIDSELNHKFPKVNFTGNDIPLSIAKRIYKIRNSIVHSKSESFRKTDFLLKATDKNIKKLNNDITLIHRITINIIQSNQEQSLQQSAKRL